MKLWFSVAVFFLWAQLCSGQNKYEWRTANSDGYTYRYVTNDPMHARLYTLKNGLTVMLSVNKKEPRIQTLIGVRAGSNNDPSDHTGLAHYLEHLLFKGTEQYGSLDWAKEKPYLDEIVTLYDTYNHTTDTARRRSVYHRIDSVSGLAAHYAIANEYDKLMTQIGAQGTNAHTSVEETVFEEDIPANGADKYLAVQAERFRDPVFRLFHTELEAVYEEKNRGLDNDRNKVYECLLAALFPDNHYGQQTTIGTIEHLKNPSLIAIRKFYEEYYVPNNMGIAMAGDFDPDVMIKKIDAAFSYMKAKPVNEYTASSVNPVTSPIIREVVGPDAENVVIGFRTPGAADTKSSVIQTVISQILSNGKAGLIDLNLNKKQQVLGAGSGVNNWKACSFFTLSGRAKSGQSLEEVKDLLLGQLALIREGRFDERLLKAIVSNFKLGELEGLENNNNRAVSLMDGFIVHRGEHWKEEVSFVEDMGKVTKQDIVSFANRYLNSNYVLVYKRKGEDKNEVKVEKPPITPVEVNKDAQSPFLKKIAAMPVTDIKPQWLDYKKDIQHAKMGTADLLYVRNTDNDIFRLYYRFDMGAWNNRLFPLAAAYLQYLGTTEYSAAQVSQQFYNLACNFSVKPGNDVSQVVISGLQENFDKAVQAFEDLLEHCQADEAALQNLKARIRKSRADSKLNKENISGAMVQYAIYGARNPFNYQLSNEELDAVTSEQLLELLHQLFHYKHTIIYYGPELLAATIASIGKVHHLPADFTPVPAPARFEKADLTVNKVLFTDYDMVQAEVNWVHNTRPYDIAQAPVIDLFNSYFGGGMGSVVFQTIRESKALAYSTYAFYSSPNKKEDKYTVVAYVGSQADKMEEAVAGMNELLDSLPRTEQALERAKQSIKQDIATQRITQDGIIFSWLNVSRLGQDTDIRKRVYDAIDQLRFEDIQRFHQLYVAHQPYVYCVLGSAKKINLDDLKKIGVVQQLSLEQLFGY